MKILISLFAQCLLYTNYVLPSSVSLINSNEVKLFETPVAYDVESTVFLNEIIKKDKEVGYKIKATLSVAPVWADPGTEFLLKFQLLQPRLYLRGKHPNANYMVHRSVWDDHPDTTFYAHWKKGVILNSYLDLKEMPDIVNYKKSLISLFQFQIIDGEFNETDITGRCDVLYESVSEHVFRKIKLRCAGDQRLWGGEARRTTRYTLEGGALHAAYADEVLQVGRPRLGVKARSWHRLQRSPAPAPAAAAPAPAAALDAALAALDPRLAACALVPDPRHNGDDDDDEEEEEVSGAVSGARRWLSWSAAGAGGTAQHAAAAARLLPALGAASAADVARLLDHPHNRPLLGELVELAGASGGAGPAAAVAALARPAADDAAPALAERYLLGLAQAARAAPPALSLAAQWARTARQPRVRAAATLAAAALAARTKAVPRAVPDAVLAAPARCQEEDEECRVVSLWALGQLRRAEAAGPLLRAAAGGGRPALAALAALARLPPALAAPHRPALAHLALASNHTLEVRAAALELVVRDGVASVAELARLVRGARGAPAELRRLLWALLAERSHRDDWLRGCLARLPPLLRGWDELALSGMSSVLVRNTGWKLGEGPRWAAEEDEEEEEAGATPEEEQEPEAELQSVQVVGEGAVRRGSVTLAAGGRELLQLRLWATGLAALAGGPGAPDEELAAGLELAVGGVQLPPLALFSGQAELLGHVWAGTASAPTAVLRALSPRAPRRLRRVLGAGARLRLRTTGAVHAAIDAHAQVSLWARSARAQLSVRVGSADEVRAWLVAPGARLRMRVRGAADARMRLAATADFYNAAADDALCVRAHLHPHTRSRSVLLESECGQPALRVRRWRNTTQPHVGRTLALGRRNDRACRAAPAPHHDGDDDGDDGGDGDDQHHDGNA